MHTVVYLLNVVYSDLHPPQIYQTVLDKALKEYAKKTSEDLTTHLLTAEINGCISTDAILTVLQGKANGFDHSQKRKSNERLTKWLTPTVNVLDVLSTTLGQGLGSVSSRMLFITYLHLNVNFSGIPPHQYHIFWNQYSSCREFYGVISL